jgi:hypothetical protein
MYCSECGAEISENQKFCQECGAELNIASDSIQEKAVNEEKPTETEKKEYQREVEPYNLEVKDVSEGVRGPDSKKALGFSLPSIGLGVAGLIMGIGIRFILFLASVTSSSPPIPFLIINITVTFILLGLGLIFGIVSQSYASTAEVVDGENTLQKLGKIFSIIGIILNAVVGAIVLIFIPFIFL